MSDLMAAFGPEDASASTVALQRISHDLRTPLTVVIGFCELLQDDEALDPMVMRDFATRIASNAWRLHAAVERLIDELDYVEYTGPTAPPSFLPPPNDDGPNASVAEAGGFA